MASKPPFSLEGYWSGFEVEEPDIEFIYNLLLEREAPLNSEEMTLALIEHRVEIVEEELQRAQKPEHTIYRPEDDYSEGQTLVFPAFDGKSGRVTAVREAENPEVAPFKVLAVDFGNGEAREFAARFADHALNVVEEVPVDQEALQTVEGVLAKYGEDLRKKLDGTLRSLDEIVQIAGRWFPRTLLIEIHEGHLNIVEAVLDVSEGGPLPTTELLEHIEVPPNVDPLLAAFSLDYALQEDDRFDEVGPAGEVLWYLRRLEPPEVLYTPQRLEYEPIAYNRSSLTESLKELEVRLDDEYSEIEGPVEAVTEVKLAIQFPHWRVGALPLSARLRQLFPTAYEAPRIRFVLVDGHSGEKFHGWVVRTEGYVIGLDEWYRRYSVPAGGIVHIRHGENSGEVIVEAIDRRPRNDWIRTITLNDEGRIGFTMLKRPIGTSYDEHMVVGLVDQQDLDEAWLEGKQRKMAFDRLVAEVFRELAKLNPQTAVHAKSLYSGVNVIRRAPPGPIFSQLVEQPYFEHVGDLYWRFEESGWS